MSAGANGQESLKQKFWLLLLDKLLLGAIAILATHLLTASLQRQDKQIDYQQAIFDTRLKVYLSVLEKATIAHDELELYWTGHEAATWSARLSELRDRWNALDSRNGHGSHGRWTDGDNVAASIQEVESVWRSNRIYFSKPVADAVEEFIHTAWADLLNDLREAEGRAERSAEGPQYPTSTYNREAAWERASSAFQRLDSLIREKLRLDGLILGMRSDDVHGPSLG